MNVYLIQLLTVNFCSDSLVRLQKAVMDNANSGPGMIFLWCNFSLVKVFRSFVISKPLHLLFMMATVEPFFMTSSYSVKKWTIADAASNTLENVELFDFHWVYSECIYWISSSCQIFQDGPVLLKFWYRFSETFFWHFYVTFVWLVFSDVDCHLEIYVLYHLELQDSYPHFRIPETSAILSDLKWILYFMSC